KSFDTVLVYKLDRLSRSQKDTLYLIEDIFIKNDIAFLSLQENFDTSTPFGKAMIGILSVFAQLEREQIKERMMLGKVGRAKAG
ncbi:recombinase family protein, partial [Streptococcus suis]